MDAKIEEQCVEKEPKEKHEIRKALMGNLHIKIDERLHLKHDQLSKLIEKTDLQQFWR